MAFGVYKKYFPLCLMSVQRENIDVWCDGKSKSDPHFHMSFFERNDNCALQIFHRQSARVSFARSHSAATQWTARRDGNRSRRHFPICDQIKLWRRVKNSGLKKICVCNERKSSMCAPHPDGNEYWWQEISEPQAKNIYSLRICPGRINLINGPRLLLSFSLRRARARLRINLSTRREELPNFNGC